MNDLLIEFTIFAVVMVFAIPLHELGHALAANYCGDDVPALQGRLTAEPWAHWDLIGSLFIGIGIFWNMPVIGWGKPVLTDPGHYRNGRRGLLLVASAGIIVNIALAVAGAAVYRGLHLASVSDPVFNQVCQTFVIVNLSLALFNLLPVPPLDGSKLLLGMLPRGLAVSLERNLQVIGILLLVLLVWQGGAFIERPLSACALLLLGR